MQNVTSELEKNLTILSKLLKEFAKALEEFTSDEATEAGETPASVPEKATQKVATKKKQTPKEDTPAVSLTDVRTLLHRLIQEDRKAEVVQLLDEVGATSLPQVKEKDLPILYKKAKELLNESCETVA